MAVSVLEKWSEHSDGGDVVTRVYTVAGALSTSHARIADDGTNRIPRKGNPDVDNPNVYAGNAVAKRVGFNFYEVTVPFSREKGGGDGSDPMNDPTQWEWQIGLQSVEKDSDVDGNPIVNSVGEVGTVPVTEDEIFLTAIRNEPFFNVAQAIAFTNSVNDSLINIPLAGAVEPGNIKCTGIAPTSAYTRDSDYVEVRYTFQVAPYHLAYSELLDRSNFAVVTAGEKPEKVDKEFNLNGRGGIISGQTDAYTEGLQELATPRGASIIARPPVASTSAIWLKYKTHKLKDFNALGIFNV